MRIFTFFSLLLALVALGTGCDWTSGGGVDSWNSRFNWVNFSGVYRGVGGGVLVTDFTATPGTPGVTNNVSNESLGSVNGTTASGGVNRRPVVPGSLSISWGVHTWADDGLGNLSAGAGFTGTIEYGTGAWSIQSTVPLAGAIRGSYQYTVAGTQGAGSAGAGSTGANIHSFTVFQEGETLQFTDNNGATYSGNFGSIRSSGGIDQQTRAGNPSVGETVIGQFSVKGVAASGLEVEIVGTLQGMVGDSGAGGFFLTNRQIFGTWIENGGRTGDVNGQTSPVRIIVTGDTEGVE